jgi:hypothetical protein
VVLQSCERGHEALDAAVRPASSLQRLSNVVERSEQALRRGDVAVAWSVRGQEDRSERISARGCESSEIVQVEAIPRRITVVVGDTLPLVGHDVGRRCGHLSA